MMKMHEARLNITWNGQNGELRESVYRDASDEELERFAAEAVRAGDVPGIARDPRVRFEGYVVDRLPPSDARPIPMIFLRPKTAFG